MIPKRERAGLIAKVATERGAETRRSVMRNYLFVFVMFLTAALFAGCARNVQTSETTPSVPPNYRATEIPPPSAQPADPLTPLVEAIASEMAASNLTSVLCLLGVNLEDDTITYEWGCRNADTGEPAPSQPPDSPAPSNP